MTQGRDRRRFVGCLAGRLLVALALLGPGGCGPTGSERRPAAESVAVAGPSDDADLARSVRSGLSEADRQAFAGVSVLTWNGAVLLTGAVTRPDHRRRAEQASRAIEGVRRVHVELRLAEPSILNRYAPDPAREHAIAAQLADGTGLGGPYVVRVVNGVVYLLGRAASRDELGRARDRIAAIDGVTWVVAHVEVADEG